MKISYNWLCEYLPEKIELEKLSNILTSVGLEVESLVKFEETKGSLQGLIIGEVMECRRHPEADKLKVTNIDIGEDKWLNIVCGAPNVATGQKVVIAKIGSTIYPLNREVINIKKANIRGIESQGMICSEDEVGISDDHTGILVLPDDAKKGVLLSDYLEPYKDWIFEIGVLPNRMDAMSHLGAAKDVCAWLSHHNKTGNVIVPSTNNFKIDNQLKPIEVSIENTHACQRYSGVSITGIKVQQSPQWLQQKLKAIGLRPHNNIVDITNFIVHETGQPLHSFDADEVKQNKIIVKNLPGKTTFITLDEKERKLDEEDLMICNGKQEPICFAGVFGGLNSGVKETTTNIFLESAWFHPLSVRKTSLRHGLRTDAAIRFEKGVDISNTVNVLKRAAIMIKEIAGGQISSEIIDIYPNPKEKTAVTLKYGYLQKISGKVYPVHVVKNILKSLGFEFLEENEYEITVAVPFSKPDITLQADIVEEIMRIDGYDNVEIPGAIIISPSVETLAFETSYKEKIANYLIGLGFSEIFTNSITNSNYYGNQVLEKAVKILNSLSTELDIMRPGLLETGLECIAYNLNRKNSNLLLFEFGKVYSTEAGNYVESEHLGLFFCGSKIENGWRNKEAEADIYFVKGVCEKIFHLCGIVCIDFKENENNVFENSLTAIVDDEPIARFGTVAKTKMDIFSIKKPVFFADIFWDKLLPFAKAVKIEHIEILKFPSVERDISIVVDNDTSYENVERSISKANIDRLSKIKLFDVFENEKLGDRKKSFAINFSFSDKEKTLTDKEVDIMVNKLIVSFEKDLNAEIRK